MQNTETEPHPTTATAERASPPIQFRLQHSQGEVLREFLPNRVLIAGFAGRDRKATQHHIDELSDIGVAPPSRVPMFYEVSPSRLTQFSTVNMIGGSSSGEVECVLIKDGDELFVSVGSDHTDRDLEAFGIMQSKQLCDKPIASRLWSYKDVQDHWDQLVMRCWANFGGEAFEMYQEGAMSDLMSPETLLAERETRGDPMRNGDLMFCGTFGAIGGIRPAASYRLEIEDPVLERKLGHTYSVSEIELRS